MAQRFYTADWHLGSELVRRVYNRPFSSVERMNAVLIGACNNYATEDDIVFHLGDFYSYGNDRGIIGQKINPNEFMKQINATFLNVEGNHDANNKVKSVGRAIRTNLGKVFSEVVLCHYPSTDERSKGLFKKGDLILCGHVHKAWKYMIDKENKVLNINVGVDVWNYKPVSEDKLIEYIRGVMKSRL